MEERPQMSEREYGGVTLAEIRTLSGEQECLRKAPQTVETILALAEDIERLERENAALREALQDVLDFDECPKAALDGGKCICRICRANALLANSVPARRVEPGCGLDCSCRWPTDEKPGFSVHPAGTLVPNPNGPGMIEVGGPGEPPYPQKQRGIENG
jgi:hypothetical protein